MEKSISDWDGDTKKIKQDTEGHTTKTERNDTLRVKTVVFKSCMTRRNGQPHVWGRAFQGEARAMAIAGISLVCLRDREEAGVSVVEWLGRRVAGR